MQTDGGFGGGEPFSIGPTPETLNNESIGLQDIDPGFDITTLEIPMCSSAWDVIDNYATIIEDAPSDEDGQESFREALDNFKEQVKDDLEKQGIPPEVQDYYVNSRLEETGKRVCENVLRNATVQGIKELQNKGLDGLIQEAYMEVSKETIDFENLGEITAEDIKPPSKVEQFIEKAKDLGKHFKETFSNKKTAVDFAVNTVRIATTFLGAFADNDAATNDDPDHIDSLHTDPDDITQSLRAVNAGADTYEDEFAKYVSSIADPETNTNANELGDMHRLNVPENPYANHESDQFDFGNVLTSDLAGREAFIAFEDKQGDTHFNNEAVKDYFELNHANPEANDLFVTMVVDGEYSSARGLGEEIHLAFDMEDINHALHDSSELADLDHQQIFRTGEDNITRAAVTVDNLGEDLDDALFNLVAANYERMGQDVTDEQIEKDVANLKASVGLTDTEDGRSALETFKDENGQEHAKRVDFFSAGEKAEKAESEGKFHQQKLETGAFIAFVDEGNGNTRVEIFVAGQSNDLENGEADKLADTNPELKALEEKGIVLTDMGRLVVIPETIVQDADPTTPEIDAPETTNTTTEVITHDDGTTSEVVTETNEDGSTTVTTTTTEEDGSVTVTVIRNNPGNDKNVGSKKPDAEYPNNDQDKFGYYDENGIWHDGDKGASNGPDHEDKGKDKDTDTAGNNESSGNTSSGNTSNGGGNSEGEGNSGGGGNDGGGDSSGGGSENGNGGGNSDHEGGDNNGGGNGGGNSGGNSNH